MWRALLDRILAPTYATSWFSPHVAIYHAMDVYSRVAFDNTEYSEDIQKWAELIVYYVIA